MTAEEYVLTIDSLRSVEVNTTTAGTFVLAVVDPQGGAIVEMGRDDLEALHEELGRRLGAVSPLDALATRLADTYGPNPNEVGTADGTEDEYGDLLSEAVEGLGTDPEQLTQAAWDRVQSVASDSEATEMRPWLDEIAAELRDIHAERYAAEMRSPR